MEEANPGGWALQSGQNFSVNHAPANIDFAAIHVWPDNWERCAPAAGAATTSMTLQACQQPESVHSNPPSEMDQQQISQPPANAEQRHCCAESPH